MPEQVVLLSCPGGLEGRGLRVGYPLYNPSLATLFRLTKLDGTVLTQVLAPDRTTWSVPEDSTWTSVALSYLELGLRHIWTGVDHLLFVSGLLLLAGTLRRVVLAITGFTLAHSITLSLSALGLMRLPQAPVEAAIALSIIFLAYEIARPKPDGLARRYPLLVSSSFGLLHGFGFAAALREVGLPTQELALGLLCFNLGVEIGQLAFIIAVLAVFGWAMRVVRSSNLETPGSFWGYALGVPAAFWLFQRLAALG
jgi:hydrogenase/urease accessory protein HupE